MTPDGHTPPDGVPVPGREFFALRQLASGRHAVHLYLRGELDLVAAPHLEATVDGLLAAGVTAIVLDLHELEYLDSSGLRALIAVSEAAARSGATVELTRGTADVMRVFDLTGLTERLPFLAR